MKVIGYLRVSTEAQDTEKNKAEVKEFAKSKKFPAVKFVEEKVSGKKSWKERKIAAVIEELGKDDILIVPELSRLGRNMLEIMEILAIAKEKEICIYAIKGHWELNGTIQSKLIAMCFAMAAEIERDLISSRTLEGLTAAKARGQILGRPVGSGQGSRLDPHYDAICAMLVKGFSLRSIAREYEISISAFTKWMAKQEIVYTETYDGNWVKKEEKPKRRKGFKNGKGLLGS